MHLLVKEYKHHVDNFSSSNPQVVGTIRIVLSYVLFFPWPFVDVIFNFATLLFPYSPEVSFTRIYANAVHYSTLYTVRDKRITRTVRFLSLIFTLVSNFALTFLTLLDFVFLLGISESFRCLIFPVYGKIFSLLDAYEVLIFVESMVLLSIESKLFHLGRLLADLLLLLLLLLLIIIIILNSCLLMGQVNSQMANNRHSLTQTQKGQNKHK